MASDLPTRKAASATPSPPTVAELIVWLSERIRTGRLVPGQRLVEIDLTRETGASRARVREALQRLETEGLVVLEEFRGASVRSFTPHEMRQIYRTRMALEGLAAGDCARVAPPEIKVKLANLQERLNGCEHSGDHVRFAQLNDEWHETIIAGAGNAYLKTFVERLRVPLYRMLFATFYEPERIDDANAGHRRITAAIIAGDSDEAERLMRAHIEEAMGVAVRLEGRMLG